MVYCPNCGEFKLQKYKDFYVAKFIELLALDTSKMVNMMLVASLGGISSSTLAQLNEALASRLGVKISYPWETRKKTIIKERE